MCLAAILIVLAGLAAYANSFSGVFVFDDLGSIGNNATIRRLPAWREVLSPPGGGETVSGRPVLNLSLAINYALGGQCPWGYHAVNLAIHILNGLLLLGILRHTFQSPPVSARLGNGALGLALAIALLWTVHPLQTESVTYIVQRAEALMALFYLGTLYCVICATQSQCSAVWYAVAVSSCFLGMATKEIMVTAPVMVLLYDGMFLAGSLSEALRRRWGLYAGLAAGWLLLAALVIGGDLLRGPREPWQPGAWAYLRSQPGVILHYLKLVVWPDPLCLDYGWPTANGVWSIVPGVVVVGLLLGATVWGWLGRRGWAFLGVWFLLILAPTSSVVPLSQMAFEHRMYLPLAAVIALVVVAGYLLGKILAGRGKTASRMALVLEIVLLGAAVVALGAATFRRNAVYHSEVGIWQDTVSKAPQNSRARNNLGMILTSAGRPAEAVEQLEESLRLCPGDATAQNNMGLALAALGRFPEAIRHYEEAMRLDPAYYAAYSNKGIASANAGRPQEAFECYRQAAGIRPDYAQVHNNWGNTLASQGRPAEAIQHYQQALQLAPDFAEAHANLAFALADTGRLKEALDHCRQAIEFRPDCTQAHNTWGNILMSAGRPAEAIEHYQEALRIQPNQSQPHNNLGVVLLSLNRSEEALQHYQKALEIQPDYADAHRNLATYLTKAGRFHEAIEHGKTAARLAPNNAQLASFVAWLMATRQTSEKGDPQQAVELAQQACALTARRDASCLDTLAAAYASAARFDDAVVTANEAWRVARAAGQKSLAEEIHVRLQLYRDRQPFRQPEVSRAKGRP